MCTSGVTCCLLCSATAATYCRWLVKMEGIAIFFSRRFPTIYPYTRNTSYTYYAQRDLWKIWRKCNALTFNASEIQLLKCSKAKSGLDWMGWLETSALYQKDESCWEGALGSIALQTNIYFNIVYISCKYIPTLFTFLAVKQKTQHQYDFKHFKL